MVKAKQATRKIGKRCVVCGKAITVYVYPDGRYRGGHYFGTISLEKPKREVEYWECPRCYRTPDPQKRKPVPSSNPFSEKGWKQIERLAAQRPAAVCKDAKESLRYLKRYLAGSAKGRKMRALLAEGYAELTDEAKRLVREFGE